MEERFLLTIRAVLFDADGVVQQQTLTLHSVLTDVLGAPLHRVDEMYRDVWEAEGPALTGHADFAVALSAVLEKWGLPGRLQDLIDASMSIHVDCAITGIVRRLRKAGVLCCLASNQMTYRARYMSEKLGYADIFDREFYSCDIGHKKPDPAYFTAILEELALPPDEVLFIDDVEANVAAARQLGIKASVFQPGPRLEPHKLMRQVLADQIRAAKLRAVADASQHEHPTADSEVMLREIEAGQELK